MRIGIISDTHGCRRTWEHIFATHFTGMDMIIHAGDVLYHGPRNPIPEEYDPKGLAEIINNYPRPILFAKGNCDSDVDAMVIHRPILSPYAIAFLNGLKVLVCHGDKLEGGNLAQTAAIYQADLLITGHTHLPVLERLDTAWHLNPGSPGMSKDPAGRPTVGRLLEDRVEIIDVRDGTILQMASIAELHGGDNG